MRFAAAFLIALASCAATLLVCIHPAGKWRVEILRMAAAGALPGLSWAELLSRLDGPDGRNGLRWTVGSVQVAGIYADSPCPVLFDTPIGPFRGHLEDEWDLEHIVNKYLGLNSDSLHGLAPQVQPGDTVVEVGPWIGAFTRHALMRGAARVIAIEPVPANLDCLGITFESEIAAGRVVLFEGAAWDESGPLRMTRPSENNPRNSSKGYNVVPEGELTVEGFRLDDILAELSVEQVDLINADIEGAERYMAAGAAETIRRSMPEIVICVHHLGDDEEAVLSVLKEIAPEYEVATDSIHARLTPPGS